MQKFMTPLILLTFASASIAQEQQEKCKEGLINELHRTGLITPNVCVDFNNYPNFNVKIHNGRYQLGKDQKEYGEQDIYAVKGLMNLMNGMPESKTELKGYTDAYPMDDRYDQDLFQAAKGEVANKKYGIPKISKSEIERIDDDHTRQVLLNYYNQWEKSGKKPVELSSANPFVDVLRNYKLSVDRSANYCKQFGIDCQKVKLTGSASALAIEANANADKADRMSKDELNCPERRGAELKFIFDDKVREDGPTYTGDYIPKYKTASKTLQDNMHIAGSLDMFSRMQKSQFAHPKDNPINDPYFLDVEKDQERFRNLMQDNPGCSKDPYSVDAARRLYWAVMHEKEQAKQLASKASGSFKSQNDLLQKMIESGDYSSYQKSPELKQIFAIATHSEFFRFDLAAKGAGGSMHAVDMFTGLLAGDKLQSEKFDKEFPHIKSVNDKKLYAQMVLTARTIAIGRPVFTEYASYFGDLNAYEKGIIYGSNKSTGIKHQDALIKDHLKINKTGKDIRRYPNAPSPMALNRHGQIETNLHPAPTSVFSCFDVYNAMADHIKDNSTDQSMLVDYLKPGQTIKMDADHVQSLQYKELYKINGQTESVVQQTKGWVCQECGSGVHVHDDGNVHIVSRDRDANWDSRKGAVQAVKSSREDGLTIGSMLNLTSYIIPDCQGCNCLKNKSGDELKAILTSDKTKKHYFTEDNGQGQLALSKNPGEIKDNKTCLFVPPVPHSCTLRPKGESEKENKINEIKGRLYCEIRDKLKKLPTHNYSGKAAMASEIMESCQAAKEVFPKPEVDCYPKLKHGFSQKSDKKIETSKGTKQ
jgi:hypothetical protein